MAIWDFYFAWLDDGGVAFNPAVHNVEDLEVVGFELAHQETEVPSINLIVRNPRVGLLNPTRKQWAWISFHKPDDTIVPVFHGRLIGHPAEMAQELVSLDFLAKPEDFEAQKTALAATLKVVGQFWDPLFVDEAALADPDSALAARPEVWHVGRTDKLVTTSNILVGEAGTLVLNEGDFLDDSLSVSLGRPVEKVEVKSDVEWTQSAFGTVDMSAFLKLEFQGNVVSYTGQGFEADWPTYGDQIGGGWFVDLSRPNLQNTDINDAHILEVPIDPRNDTPDFEIEDWWEDSPEGFDFWWQLAYDEWLQDRLLDPIREARFALWEFEPDFFVRYEANRARKEKLSFTLTADVQRLVAEGVEDQEVETITANSTKLDTVIDPKSRGYFNTDRGQTSIAYLMNLARARILFAARAVEITVQIPFLTGLNLSCKHDVILSCDDLPGGEAGGKVLGYRLSMDQSGAMTCTVTFGAVVGEGNTLAAPDPGEESYVEEEYVEDEYQVFYGESLQPIPGEIEYERPAYTPNDDGLDFGNLRAPEIIQDISATTLLHLTTNGAVDQIVTIGARTYTLKDALTGANQVLRGLDQNALAKNLADAINREELFEGNTYGTGTVAHETVSATFLGAIVRVTARVGGVGGNAIAVSTNVTGATWDSPTLEDGSDGLVVSGTADEQEAHLLTDPEPGSIKMAIARLNEVPTHVQMALKPVTGGPFETTVPLVVQPLMVPKTIDLAAAAI